MKLRFNQNKIHLAAHSWGSIIGLNLAFHFPEKYYSYTGFSQIINWVENDKLSYLWLLDQAKKTNNKKAIKELLDVGEPPYTKDFKQWSVIRKWQFKNNTLFYDAGDKNTPTFLSCLKIMLYSPDYSLKDIYNSFVRGFKLSYSEELLHDIITFDFFTEIPKIQIPVMFIHGRKEKHVFPELITRFYEKLDAPKGKSLYWSENSSHVFHLNDARENEQRLLEHLQVV